MAIFLRISICVYSITSSLLFTATIDKLFYQMFFAFLFFRKWICKNSQFCNRFNIFHSNRAYSNVRHGYGALKSQLNQFSHLHKGRSRICHYRIFIRFGFSRGHIYTEFFQQVNSDSRLSFLCIPPENRHNL